MPSEGQHAALAFELPELKRRKRELLDAVDHIPFLRQRNEFRAVGKTARA
jgi:hypothetical protein